MSGSPSTPRWLLDFQAHLRAHPVARAVFFWIGTWILFAILRAFQGQAITIRFLATGLAVWGVGAVLFFFLMRWQETRDAR